MHTVLAQQVRARRRELGLSQQQLAAAAGVSRTSLSHVEQGRTAHAQIDMLSRILRALDLDLQLAASSPAAERVAARLAQQARVQAQRERHLRLAIEMATDPRAARARIRRAREVVALWRRQRTCSPLYIRRWTRLLALPPARLARRMASLGAWENALFQNTPWSWAWT